MYEKREEPPLSRASFLARLANHIFAAGILLATSLAVGVWGYMQFEKLDLLDAFLNAAMLLGGMGPINTPAAAAGKLFAGLYALYAGLVFVVTAAMIVAPVALRVLHKFHWDARL